MGLSLYAWSEQTGADWVNLKSRKSRQSKGSDWAEGKNLREFLQLVLTRPMVWCRLRVWLRRGLRTKASQITLDRLDRWLAGSSEPEESRDDQAAESLRDS
jgi:hypothetical protein